ncbi:MAG: hypothetical protein M1839_008381 [Geoglossum umbratile]|nr:MAG: hypothetical protein M1839_008381 [Geoglossum umbratile]
MNHLVIVGACYLDTILAVDHYPAEDEKLRASSLVRRRGGNCFNTAEVLQQLVDLSSRAAVSLVLSAVLPASTSAGSQQIKSSLPETVDLTHCFYREEFNEPASSYIIKSRSVDSRTIVNFNNLPEMTSSEFTAMAGKLGDKAGYYHFEASTILCNAGRIPGVILECMLHLRRYFPAVRISVEVEKPGRVGLRELAAQADVVFYSKSWAQDSGYLTPEDCLRAQAILTPKASLLCCTWGNEGAGALELPSLTYTHSPAFVVNAVDAIGAGDTFIAGMLYGLTCHGEDWDTLHKLGFANELAGHKVAQEGFSGLGIAMQHALN